ncbi:MAG TPA: hypothetical protein VFG21_01095 [Xanthomonadaceae bacterium]|nr:hypothetical protein [Xanthomonadaceae bacterium]
MNTTARLLAMVIAPASMALSGGSAAQVFDDGFESVPAEFQETHCTLTRESIADPVQRALFKPDGYEEALIAWNVLFPPDREYPDSYGDKIAVGSITFYPDRRKLQGLYMTVPFTADETFHELSHRPATATLTFPLDPNYRWQAADSVYVTISPCRGDFRTIAVTNPDPDDETYTKGCRKRFHQTEKFVYGATNCPLYPGHRYFLNIVFEEIGDDHLDPTTTSCSTEYYSDGSPKPQDHICEAGFKHD